MIHDRPTAFIYYDGEYIDADASGDDWEALAIASIDFNWGREVMVEHSDPGSASIQIMARPSAVHILRDPLNVRVVIGFKSRGATGDATEATMFRGQITAGEIAHYTLVDGEPVFIAQLTAAGRLAEVERIKITDEAPRGAESYAARLAYLNGKLSKLGLRKPVVSDTSDNGRKIATRDYKNTSVLEALKELFNTYAQQLIYSPYEDQITGEPDAHYNQDSHLSLAWVDGAVVVIPGDDGQAADRMIYGDDVDMVNAEISPYRAMSAIGADGFWRERYDGENSWSDHTLFHVLDPSRDGMTFKLSGLGFARWPEDEDVSLEDSFQAVAKLGETMRLFQHPPITRRFTEPVRSWAALRIALAGEPWRATFYVMGSVYTALGEQVAFCRPIGGSARYEPGDDGSPRWEVTTEMAAIPLADKLKPITLGELDDTRGRAETRRNSALNPSPQRNDGDYYPHGGGVEGARVVGPSPGGNAFYRLTYTAGSTSGKKGRYHDVLQDTTAGEVWTASIHVRPSQSLDMRAAGEFRLANDAVSENQVGEWTHCPADEWTRIHVTLRSEAKGNMIRHRTYTTGTTLDPGFTLDIDAELIEQTAELTPYFSGDSARIGHAYAWAGTTDVSQSIEYSTSDGFTYADYHPSLSLADLANVERGLSA